MWVTNSCLIYDCVNSCTTKKNLHKSKLKTHKFTETKVKKHQLKKKRATKYKEPKSQIKI